MSDHGVLVLDELKPIRLPLLHQMEELRVLRLLEQHSLVELLERVEQTMDRIFSRLQRICVQLEVEVLLLVLDHGVGHVLAAEEEVLLLVVLRRKSMESVEQRLEHVVLELLER